MNSKQVGDISEVAVKKFLLEQGFSVLDTVGDNDRYDLVYEKEEEFYRVQVKTGRYKNGKILFDCENKTTENGKVVKKQYTKKDIDFFFVYYPESEKIFKIPVSEAPSSRMEIRVEEAKQDDPRINWASDYQVSP
jgi:hypothetical protein